MKIVLLFLLGMVLVGCNLNEDTVIPPTTAVTQTATPQIGISFATKIPPTVPVLQTTPSPLPTASVTPTATPLIHAVQAGETLLGIAIQHGTTTEEIQALNPEINPRLLLVGQEIILPQPTPVAQLAAGTAVPVQIEVVQIHTYPAPVGSVWLVGEVSNAGELAVENVQIAVGLVNEAGKPVVTVTGWVASPIIQPEATAPFAILLDDPPAFEFKTASIVAGQTAVDLGSRYLDLKTAELTLNNQTNSVVLEGLIQNFGSETAVQPTLIATFYDAQDQISGFAQLILSENLEPAQTVPFTLETTPPGGTAVRVNTFLISQRLPATPVDN